VIGSLFGSLPLGFAQPLVLLGLLGLPVLWWLLRLVPPRPRRINFPPARLLFEIAPKEETPARTPWWLVLLRLTLAALVIIAAAGPLWNPPLATSSRGAPLLVMLDDGWGAAASWDARLRTADELMARAETDNRGVAVLPLSETARDVSLQVAGAARVQIKQLKPKPYTVERTEALPLIERFLATAPDVEIVWLSDGVDLGKGGEFIAGLKHIVGGHPLTVVAGGLPVPHALAAADNAAGALTVKVLRAQTGSTDTGFVNAIDLKGLPLGEAPFAFRSDAQEAEAVIDLPVEIRNDVARLEIAAERSAGAVQLLDKRWRRRTVGVVSGSAADRSQPLIGASYYLARALNPFADIRLAEGVAPAEAVKRFLDQHLPMLILADVGNVTEAREQLNKWIDNGGVLVRFAGPHLAGATDDDLVPVKLRRGGRVLGGSLSWEKPQQLAAFAREGPFAGMPVPNDVTVSRQVLAEPDSLLTDRTWATLADGTPLVTAQRYGKGLLVLFHVTADTRWSDLPLSGTFVDMLRRIVALAASTATADAENAGEAGTASGRANQAVPPTRVLDGFGAFSSPPPTARPIPANFSARANADHPPGFYGPPEGLVAVNTLAPSDRLAPLDFSGLNARLDVYRHGEPLDLRGPIFLAALVLLMLDALVVIVLSGILAGMLPRRRVATTLLAACLLSALTMPHPAQAQSSQQPAPPLSSQQQDFAMKAASQTHLAYIITGDADVDAVSKAGLQGLTLFLAQRTALEAGEPIGLDPTRDELAFFPLIYWPVSASAPKPSQTALDRIDTYMKRGGTVLFDTRDAVDAPPGPGGEMQGPGMVTLRSILSSLDIPELEPVSRDHVLTKTFFLLRDFPGRFTTGQLWVEALPAETEEETNRPARAGDGVSSILITSNDLAGAWAIRPDGQPMLPLVPGEPRQREFAFRAGVNIVMYALTGNYKADQVHIPALLERLGQ
jgi:N-terminal double-transmembrane domain